MKDPKDNYRDNSKALKIVHANIYLPKKYKGKSIIDMLEEQEGLIIEYIELGYTRRQFFEHAQEMAVSEGIMVIV